MTIVGDVIERLEATGSYDDALIVVLADHGVAFRAGIDRRGSPKQQSGTLPPSRCSSNDQTIVTPALTIMRAGDRRHNPDRGRWDRSRDRVAARRCFAVRSGQTLERSKHDDRRRSGDVGSDGPREDRGCPSASEELRSPERYPALRAQTDGRSHGPQGEGSLEASDDPSLSLVFGHEDVYSDLDPSGDPLPTQITGTLAGGAEGRRWRGGGPPTAGSLRSPARGVMRTRIDSSP